MPLYEYRCKACGHQFEVIQKFSDAPVRKCPKCGKRVERLVSSSAIQFKGTGWYVTDYARSSSTSQSKREGSSDGKGEKEAGGESAKTETAEKTERTESPKDAAKASRPAKTKD